MWCLSVCCTLLDTTDGERERLRAHSSSPSESDSGGAWAARSIPSRCASATCVGKRRQPAVVEKERQQASVLTHRPLVEITRLVLREE